MATTVYCVIGEEGRYFTTTKRAAIWLARDARRNGDDYVIVTRHEVAKLPRRELYVRLLNGESWAASSEEIEIERGSR